MQRQGRRRSIKRGSASASLGFRTLGLPRFLFASTPGGPKTSPSGRAPDRSPVLMSSRTRLPPAAVRLWHAAWVLGSSMCVSLANESEFSCAAKEPHNYRRSFATTARASIDAPPHRVDCNSRLDLMACTQPIGTSDDRPWRPAPARWRYVVLCAWQSPIQRHHFGVVVDVRFRRRVQ